jgi:hypothetical protein
MISEPTNPTVANTGNEPAGRVETGAVGGSNDSSKNALNLDELRQRVYDARVLATQLRRDFYEQPVPFPASSDSTAPAALPGQLRAAEETLLNLERQVQERQAQLAERPRTDQLPIATSDSLILDSRKTTKLLGAATTGLETQIHLRMAQLPTAICHLLDPQETPLVTCLVDNTRNETRRIRVSSYIDGYSARSIQTYEIGKQEHYEFRQLPTLFSDRVRTVTELTRATLNITVEDLDGKLEVEQTKPIWLLARTTAPLAVRDPKTGQWCDMTSYFGAFVTPNEPSLISFLRVAAGHHPARRLLGYQGQPSEVEPQAEAIFNALKTEAGINYVNSVIAFSPEDGAANQRVRLPRESLRDKQANCIDGTVLFASLLEAASLNPALVIVPQHAFVGWETWSGSDEWNYLETTMIGSHSFQEARQQGENNARLYQAVAASGNPAAFRRWSLRELRTIRHITPME